MHVRIQDNIIAVYDVSICFRLYNHFKSKEALVAEVIATEMSKGATKMVQSRGFSIRCLRFKSCVAAPACKARFRPVANLCREGVEPTGFHRKVSVLYIELPPFPGATAKLPQASGVL